MDSTGHLYDPDLVEFRVIDLTTSTQVFPASGYEDVTEDGRVAKGVFRAFDVTDGVGWTPESDATVGPHRIDWRFTDADDDSVTRTWSFEFDVYTAGFEIGYWTYLSPNRVRDEGYTTTQVTDARVVRLITRAQQYVERECRQPFRPIRHTIESDGTGGSLWALPMPLLGVDELRINAATSATSTNAYRAYWSGHLGEDPGWRPSDNRRNPRITLASSIGTTIYDGVVGASRFLPAAKAHSLSAVWGYVEADGTTPLLIQDAMLRIVLATAVRMGLGPGGSGGGVSGPIVFEKTDSHEIQYAFSYTAGSMDSPLATSPEVLDILRRYRAPIGIASPATTWSGLRP